MGNRCLDGKWTILYKPSWCKFLALWHIPATTALLARQLLWFHTHSKLSINTLPIKTMQIAAYTFHFFFSITRPFLFLHIQISHADSERWVLLSGTASPYLYLCFISSAHIHYFLFYNFISPLLFCKSTLQLLFIYKYFDIQHICKILEEKIMPCTALVAVFGNSKNTLLCSEYSSLLSIG